MGEQHGKSVVPEGKPVAHRYNREAYRRANLYNADEGDYRDVECGKSPEKRRGEKQLLNCQKKRKIVKHQKKKKRQRLFDTNILRLEVAKDKCK